MTEWLNWTKLNKQNNIKKKKKKKDQVFTSRLCPYIKASKKKQKDFKIVEE